MQNGRENHRIHASRLHKILQVQRITLQHLPAAALTLFTLTQRFHYIAGNINADRSDTGHPLFNQIEQYSAAGADIQHLGASDIIQNSGFIIRRVVHLAQVAVLVMEAVERVAPQIEQIE
ncbi:hypothetical protein D3C75_743250 [compost metagenome]